MYRSRNEYLYPERRGGFSNHPELSPQGVSGLGSLGDDFGTWLSQQSSDVQNLFYSWRAVNPGSSTATEAPLTTTQPASFFSQIPTSLYWLLGGFIVVSFLLPTGGRR